MNITIQVVKIGTRKTVLLFNKHLPSSPHLQRQPSVPHDDYQHGNGLTYAPFNRMRLLNNGTTTFIQFNRNLSPQSYVPSSLSHGLFSILLICKFLCSEYFHYTVLYRYYYRQPYLTVPGEESDFEFQEFKKRFFGKSDKLEDSLRAT